MCVCNNSSRLFLGEELMNGRKLNCTGVCQLKAYVKAYFSELLEIIKSEYLFVNKKTMR